MVDFRGVGGFEPVRQVGQIYCSIPLMGLVAYAGEMYTCVHTAFKAMLSKQLQQFTQVPNLIGDLQIAWAGFGGGIVPTRIQSIVHAALDI